MANTLDNVIVQLEARLDKLESDLRQAVKKSRDAGKDAGKGFSDEFIAASQQLMAGLAGLGAGLLGVGAAAVKLAGDMEQAEIAFSTLLGSGEKARKFLDDLADFAAKTPFEFTGLQQSSRQLLAFGFKAEQIIPIMTRVGDAVAALGGGEYEISRVVRALGQMQAKAKVSAEEMMQLAELGIPAWELLAKKIGVSVPEAMKMAEKGAIGGAEGIQAILEGLGDRFKGSMERQSKTLLGLFSTVKDNVTLTMVALGREIVDALDLKGFTENVISALSRLRDWLESGGLRKWLVEQKQNILLLAAAVTGALVPALYALARGIGTVLLRLAPWALAGVALVKILEAWGVSMSDLGPVMQRVGQGLLGFMQLVQGTGQAIAALAASVGKALGWLYSAVEQTIGQIGQAWEKAKNLNFVGAAESLGGIKGVWERNWNGFLDDIGSGFDAANATLKRGWDNLAGAWTGKVTQDGLRTTKLLAGVTDELKAALEGVTGAANAAAPAIKGAGDASGEAAKKTDEWKKALERMAFDRLVAGLSDLTNAQLENLRVTAIQTRNAELLREVLKVQNERALKDEQDRQSRSIRQWVQYGESRRRAAEMAEEADLKVRLEYSRRRQEGLQQELADLEKQQRRDLAIRLQYSNSRLEQWNKELKEWKQALDDAEAYAEAFAKALADAAPRFFPLPKSPAEKGAEDGAAYGRAFAAAFERYRTLERDLTPLGFRGDLTGSGRARPGPATPPPPGGSAPPTVTGYPGLGGGITAPGAIPELAGAPVPVLVTNLQPLGQLAPGPDETGDAKSLRAAAEGEDVPLTEGELDAAATDLAKSFYLAEKAAESWTEPVRVFGMSLEEAARVALEWGQGLLNLFATVSDTGSKAINSLAGLGTAVAGALSGNLAQVFEGLMQFLQPFIDALQPILEPLNDAFMNLLQALSPLAAVIGQILAAFAPLIDAVAIWLTPFVRILALTLAPLVPIIQLVGRVFKFVAELVASIWNAIANAINAVLGWTGVHLETIDVSTDEAEEALGDFARKLRESNVPDDLNAKYLRAVALGRTGAPSEYNRIPDPIFAHGRPQTIVLQLDSRRVAEVVIDRQGRIRYEQSGSDFTAFAR